MDDSPWGTYGFRLKNFRIRPTVRRKRANVASDNKVGFVIFSMSDKILVAQTTSFSKSEGWKLISGDLIGNSGYNKITSGFAITHVVVSVRHPITY